MPVGTITSPSASAGTPTAKHRRRTPGNCARAFSVLIESEPRLYLFVLTRFLHANRYPPPDHVRGHASLGKRSHHFLADGPQIALLGHVGCGCAERRSTLLLRSFRGELRQ